MGNLTFHVPINGVSFGQTSTAILRECFNRGMEPNIFPIGGKTDLSTQQPDKEFGEWLSDCMKKAFSNHKRDTPTIKLWHISGAHEKVSTNQSIFTFYELDSPTEAEVNLLNMNERVIVSSTYTKGVFEKAGVKNVHFVPLGFDSRNFYSTGKEYFTDGRITFNVVGKLEKRKHHKKLIRAWLKKYGNNPNYFLNCAVYNPFLVQKQPNGQQVDMNQQEINAIMGGQKVGNVQFSSFFPRNEQYNDYLNQGDIVIGMSGGEGWGLPEFQSVCLGKNSVILNANAYKDWADKDNSVMVEPDGQVLAYDNRFFREGDLFNQGRIFTWDEEEFLNACDEAIQRHLIGKNEAGVKLGERLTFGNTLDELLKII